VTYTFGSFEEYAVGTEVMFQEPNFSGSTDAMIINDPLALSLVADDFAYAGVHSDKVYFQFVNNALTNWCRLTTYAAPNLPNPAIRFDQGSVLSFWMRGVPEPSALLMLGLVAGLLRAARHTWCGAATEVSAVRPQRTPVRSSARRGAGGREFFIIVPCQPARDTALWGASSGLRHRRAG
jgi:hypothetical protein